MYNCRRPQISRIPSGQGILHVLPCGGMALYSVPGVTFHFQSSTLSQISHLLWPKKASQSLYLPGGGVATLGQSLTILNQKTQIYPKSPKGHCTQFSLWSLPTHGALFWASGAFAAGLQRGGSTWGFYNMQCKKMHKRQKKIVHKKRHNKCEWIAKKKTATSRKFVKRRLGQKKRPTTGVGVGQLIFLLSLHENMLFPEQKEFKKGRMFQHKS